MFARRDQADLQTMFPTRGVVRRVRRWEGAPECDLRVLRAVVEALRAALEASTKEAEPRERFPGADEASSEHEPV